MFGPGKKPQVCLILKVILSVVILSGNLNTSEDYWLGLGDHFWLEEVQGWKGWRQKIKQPGSPPLGLEVSQPVQWRRSNHWVNHIWVLNKINLIQTVVGLYNKPLTPFQQMDGLKHLSSGIFPKAVGIRGKALPSGPHWSQTVACKSISLHSFFGRFSVLLRPAAHTICL